MTVRASFRDRATVQLEILALRHQLCVAAAPKIRIVDILADHT
jgi:hypothetical protein